MPSDILTVVVEFGKGSQVLHKAKKYGITGGTIMMGRGTVHQPILELLSLAEIRKEIVVMVGKTAIIEEAKVQLSKQFKFTKRGHGICYVTSLSGYCGMHYEENYFDAEMAAESEESSMYDLVTVIVDRGVSEKVMDLANAAGGKGGTIVHARGSGIHETSRVFAMEIEPEKDIVLLILPNAITSKVISEINKGLDIEKPGNGVLFVQPVKDVVGLMG